MANRTRTKQLGYATGTDWKITTGSPSTSTVSLGYETCWDVTGGYVPDRNFDVQRQIHDPGILNGNKYAPDGTLLFSAQDYPLAAPFTWGHAALETLPSNAAIATEIAARANPGREYVDLPLFMFELKDLPSMLRQIGDIIRRRNWHRTDPKAGLSFVGSVNLAYQFGWKPLLSDLSDLVGFTKVVEDRVEMLKRIDRGQVIMAHYRTSTGQSRGSRGQGAAAASLVVDWENNTNRDVWGYCRWVATTGFPDLSNAENARIAARKALLGLHANASGAWNAMPWTWLIDWFSSFGSYLAINRANVVGCELKSVHICKHTKSDFGCTKYSVNDQLTYTPFSATWETKSRIHATPTPLAAFMPFLTAWHIGIIGSLHAQKYRGSIRY